MTPAVLIVALAGLSVPPRILPATRDTIAGIWAGGTNATGSWQFAQVRLGGAGRDVLDVPGANAAGLPIEDLQLIGDSLHFRVRTPLGVIGFAGTRHDDVIEGTLIGAAPGASLHLVRTVIPPTSQGAAAVGTWDLGGDERLVLTGRAFGQLTGLVLARHGGGDQIRRSFFAVPAGPDHYLVSGSIVSALRRDELLVLQRDASQAVSGIVWRSPNGAERLARRAPSLREVTVRIPGSAGTIVGTLLLPDGPGPHPGVVVVGGSGPTGRDVIVVRAREFARIGVAALTWDKRGTGESDGDYFTATFEDLADDAARALAFLQSQPGIDAARTGMTGHSQGGWVAPMAAVRAARPPAWLVITSGGPITPAAQEEWRAATQTRAARGSADQAAAAAAFMHRKWAFGMAGGGDWNAYLAAAGEARGQRWGGIVDPIMVRDSMAWAFIRSLRRFDPMDAPKRLTMPVLILFGDHDEEQPVEDSRARWLDAFRSAGKTNYTIETIPGASHSLWFAEVTPRPIVAAPTETIARWLTSAGMMHQRR
jgi:uncharacterized protein